MSEGPLIEVIDTFHGFQNWWKEYGTASPEDQLSTWQTVYMSSWPELLGKQISQYAFEGIDWGLIATSRIFPVLSARLPAIEVARNHLLDELVPVLHLAQERLGYFPPIVGVVYVGLGLGAGWADTFSGSPALLFGLENIVEEGWVDRASIRGLVAHELGHLMHQHWRSERGGVFGTGPVWQLYHEGFAQRCEQQILGCESWHMNAGVGSSWLTWCQTNKAKLAAEFGRRMDVGEDVRHFFGSWFDFEGVKQTGYFLGCEAISQLEAEFSLREIACLNDVEVRIRAALASIGKTEKI